MVVVAYKPLFVGHAFPDLFLHVFLVWQFAYADQTMVTFIKFWAPFFHLFKGLPWYNWIFVACCLEDLSKSQRLQYEVRKIIFYEFMSKISKSFFLVVSQKSKMFHELHFPIEEGWRRMKGKWIQAPCFELFRAFGYIFGEVYEIGTVLGQFPCNFPVLLSYGCWFLNILLYFHHFQWCFCDNIFQDIGSCLFVENHNHGYKERNPMCFL